MEAARRALLAVREERVHPATDDKVLAGWGDFLFYGFADEQEASLAAWLS